MKTKQYGSLALALFNAIFALNATYADVFREAVPAVVNPVLRSVLRPTLELNGQWDFATDPKLAGEAGEWYLPKKELPEARPITVPGCWEAQGVGEPGPSHTATDKLAYEKAIVQLRSAYTGAAWYKRQVTVPADWQGKQIWLKLGGVNCQGWLWVNGRQIAHDWAYCGTWKYNITDLVTPGREATIAVLARNDLSSRRGESNCLRAYGGLFRGVELEATPAISIENAFVEPLFDQKKARLHIKLRDTAPNGSKEARTVRIRVSTGKQEAGETHLTINPGATRAEVTADISLDPFQPWSPENPFLYQAEIVLEQAGKPVDGWVERFGMKKYEVRDSELYLNNSRYFIRACSDNHVYPTTVCSPASRGEHVKRLRIIKSYGFNCVRMHTHCEVPEYFEAADEVGMLIQPELPYYGATLPTDTLLNHMSCAPETPKEDLLELVTHYRRYTSLAIYCGGNERNMPSPLGEELFQLSKSLDASRPWLALDGASNYTATNTEADHYGYGANVEFLTDKKRPMVRHEFSSMGVYEDPRLEPEYDRCRWLPNKTLREAKDFVRTTPGLDWNWASACLESGRNFQGIWHKQLIESARLDPLLDGFSFWLMSDMPPIGVCGILDVFFKPKHSTPEFFREFNSPTVILARAVGTPKPEALGWNPGRLIHTGGDVLEVDWVVSHFQPKAVENGTLVWRVVSNNSTLAEGKITGVNVAAGSVPVVGRSRIELPVLPKAVRAKLEVTLEGTGSNNSWDLWIFPKFQVVPGAGKGMAVSPSLVGMLEKRYPGMVVLGGPQADTASVIVARSLFDSGVMEALEAGKNVVCLSLPGFDLLQPGTTPGVWAPDGVSNQAGTAIATHPAFGDFPNTGWLDQGWFRLVDQAEKLDAGHKLRTVEPLMVGLGRKTNYVWGMLSYPLGFNLYTFQANVGKGRLLETGLNLVSDNPEAVHLLDQIIRYARSLDFHPEGTLNPSLLREH